jgi:hypothetical protein
MKTFSYFFVSILLGLFVGMLAYATFGRSVIVGVLVGGIVSSIVMHTLMGEDQE